jgi:hypothetical protein
MEAYPLQWPIGWKRTKNPKRSRFGTYNSKPTIHSGTQKILDEIRKLTGSNKDVIISTNLKLRQDGLPYSAQREPEDKGVAIYFTMANKEAMVIACDSFDKIGCNIYACALTIEAMRGIERWGCSELLQRAFMGFKALPEQTVKRSCWEILGIPYNSTEPQVTSAYREKAKTAHPDRGGTDAAFIELQNAYMEALSVYS